jgi:hypothetical protein
MSDQQILISLNVPPVLEEDFVDCLLALDILESFSSSAVNAHNECAHEKMSLAEQVAGRQKKINFQIYLLENNLPKLLQQLKACFSGAEIQYWLLPVLAKGNI